MLDRWPEDVRGVLERCISVAQPGDFAVFDADNTLWRYDLTEAMMVWLERRGVIRLQDIPAHRMPIAPRAGETVWSYYLYLCERSLVVGYQWAAQCFAGVRVATLRSEMVAMLEHGGPFDVARGHGETRGVDAIEVPRAFEAQRQLVRALIEAGVDVWIVSASPEELVRRFAMEHAGFPFSDDHICGVNLLLSWEDGRVDSGAIARDRGETPWRDASWDDAQVTGWPVTPLTWFEGKLAAIRRWIEPHRAPLLVSGDSPNDLPMMRIVDKDRGVCVRVRAKSVYDGVFAEESSAAGGQWISVEPGDLAPVRLV